MSWYMAPRPLTSLLCEVSRARRRQCFARRRYYYDVPEKINLSHLIVTQSLIFIISSVVMTNKKTTHRDCRECNANKWPDAKKTSFKVYISIGRKTCMNALHYVSFENRYCVKRRCRSCTWYQKYMTESQQTIMSQISERNSTDQKRGITHRFVIINTAKRLRVRKSSND